MGLSTSGGAGKRIKLLPLVISCKARSMLMPLWIDCHTMAGSGDPGDRKYSVRDPAGAGCLFALQQAHESLSNIAKTKQGDTNMGHSY